MTCTASRCMRVLASPKVSSEGKVRAEGDLAGPQRVDMLTDESESAATAELKAVPDVFALGDVCANPEKPLPALAQVGGADGGVVGRHGCVCARRHVRQPRHGLACSGKCGWCQGGGRTKQA